MRNKFALIFLLFTSFAFPQNRFSYYKCPKCDNFVSRISLPSYGTAGAKFYTDGKISGPSYRERPEVVICENCKYPFWMKDDFADPNCFQAPVFSPDGSSLVLKSQKSVFYGPETYDKFIRNHVYCGRDQEKYLLTRYWWALNDRVRNKLVFLSDPCDSDTARTNLIRLADIYREENDEIFFLPGTAEGEKLENNKILLKSLTSVTRLLNVIARIYTVYGNITAGLTELMSETMKVNIRLAGQSSKTNLDKIYNNLLAIAELYRNLGRFEECADALSDIDSDNGTINYRKSSSSELCDNKIRLVGEL